MNLRSLNPMGLLANPWALGAVAVVVFGLGLTFGIKLMAGKLGDCREELGQTKTAYAQLHELSERQNKIVLEMATASKSALEKGRQATIKAQAMVRQQQSQVDRLTALLASPTGKSCSTAIADIKGGVK